MDFKTIYSTSTNPVISLEFFPPKSAERLPKTLSLIERLSALQPNFMTVTYGAGGTTKSLTQDIVKYIHTELKILTVPHLTCISHSQKEIFSILSEYQSMGISHLLALRGDLPSDGTKSHNYSHAHQLVTDIHSNFKFSLAVAGYPEKHQESPTLQSDLDFLKRKVDSGAEVIFTQLFFDIEVYLKFVDHARSAGISVPIIPGIMPISNYEQLARFKTMCGASVPKSLEEKLFLLKDNSEELKKYTTDYAVEMCSQLLNNGVMGLHLYTLNQASQVEKIFSELF